MNTLTLIFISENYLLNAKKGTISEDEHMIQRLKYQLIETYREIALIEDTDINLTGGDKNKTILRNDL